MQIDVCHEFHGSGLEGTGVDCQNCGTLNRPSKNWNYVGCEKSLAVKWIWMKREATGKGIGDLKIPSVKMTLRYF